MATPKSPLVDEPIVLVCSADENYAMPMTVMLYSALANLKSKEVKILLFILDGGIKPSTKRKIESSLQFNQLEIHWIEVERERFKNLPAKHLTPAVYYRLSMAEVLPEQYTKVIYLDSDMVVLGDLQELWNIEIEEEYVLAVRDGSLISTATGLSNYQELGLPPDALYFNSGLLVVNLQKWRDDQIGARAIQFVEKNHKTIHQFDQDALNAILVGKWREIDPRWNQLPQLYLIPIEAGFFDSPEKHRAALDDPLIIHYAGAKPWHLGCDHPKIDQFEKYLDQTTWAGTRDTQRKRLVRKLRRLASLK